MSVIKVARSSHGLGRKTRASDLNDEGEREMIDFKNRLNERRIVTMFFALLAGISAVSMAVLPAITQI
jgi:hypothetical protein